ncbi:MAG: MATE family efflux transporter [Pseudomonadota bacterium]
MSRTANLSHGPVLSVLLKFTFPILLSFLLQITYGTVDLFIVGQFASIGDLSGVTVGSQVMHAVTVFYLGLSMGTTILVGQYIGAQESDKAAKVIGSSIAFFTLLAFFIAAILILLCEQIASFMQTPVESLEKASSYLFIAGFGAFFIVFYNLIGSIFRGLGDAKTPLITVAIACVINIILDLFFIAVLNMGASGAALATVIAQASSVFFSLLLIRKKQLPFTFSTKDISFHTQRILAVVKLGFPLALQAVLVSISFLFVTSIINGFGVAASAAVGIVEKITGLIMIVPISFGQSLSAFTAQNFGAKQYDRAKKGLGYAISLSWLFGAVTTYLAIWHGTIFTQIFTSDPVTTEAALLYLKSYAVDVMLVGIMFSMNGYFNGCGKTTFVMFHSILSAFAIRIPLAYFFSGLENTSLFIIGLATPMSTALQIVLCILYFIRMQRYIKTIS